MPEQSSSMLPPVVTPTTWTQPMPGSYATWNLLNKYDNFFLSRLVGIPVIFLSIVDPFTDTGYGAYAGSANLYNRKINPKNATGAFWSVVARVGLLITNLSVFIKPEWARNSFPADMRPKNEPQRPVVVQQENTQPPAEQYQKWTQNIASHFLPKQQVTLNETAGLKRFHLALDYAAECITDLGQRVKWQVDKLSAMTKGIESLLRESLNLLDKNGIDKVNELKIDNQPASQVEKLGEALKLASERLNSWRIETLTPIKSLLTHEQLNHINKDGSFTQQLDQITELLPKNNQQSLSKYTYEKLKQLFAYFLAEYKEREVKVDQKPVPPPKNNLEIEQVKAELDRVRKKVPLTRDNGSSLICGSKKKSMS